MDNIDYEKLANAISKGSARGGIKFDMSDMEKFKDSLKNIDKIIKNNTITYGQLGKEILGAKKAYKDLTGQIEKLDEQIEALADSEEEADKDKLKQLYETRLQVKAVQDQNLKIKANTEYMAAMGQGFVQGTKIMVGAAGNFAKGLQSNADAFSLAGGVMNAGIDVANAGAQATSKGLGAMGSTLANSTNPKLKNAGIIAGIAGTAIGGLGDAASAAAKFLVDFLVKEAQKLVEAFDKTSASGAMFADGMTGMSNAAHSAGLTVAQFSNVVSKNSVELAQSGLGVTEGAKKIGAALAAGGPQMKKELLNLGYGFEEQAELTATTIANMRRTAGGNIDNKAVAEQTQKYAENLRTIASITGEDAKAKVKQAQDQNQLLAFQQKMAGKSDAQRAQIDAAMATMTEQEKKNFRDRVVLGTVINQEGAIYEATVAGAREKGEAALALFNNNELTADSNAKLNAQYGEQIKESVLAQTALGTAAYAAGGALTEVAKSQLDVLNQANTYTKEAVENGRANVQAQKETNDKTTENLNSARIQAQDMAKTIENIAQEQLPRFGEAVKSVLETINNQLKHAEEKPWWKTAGRTALEVGGTALGYAGGGALAATETVATGGAGAVLAPALTYAGGAAGGYAGGKLADILGFASGGISHGNNKSANGGQLAMVSEGGIAEAHVPLPDGKSIPVDFDNSFSNNDKMMKETVSAKQELNSFSNNDKMMKEMVSAMQELATALQANNPGSATGNLMDKFDDMIGHLRDHKDLTQKLINVTV